MKKILVLTSGEHASFNDNFIKILKTIKFAKIILITSNIESNTFSKIGSNIKLVKVKYPSKVGFFTKLWFFAKYLLAIKNTLKEQRISLVIITTAQNAFLNLFLPNIIKNFNIFMFFHNINSFYFGKKKSLEKILNKKDKFPLWKRIINNRLLKRINIIFVLTEYLKKNSEILFPKKRVEVIPFRISTEKELIDRKKFLDSNLVPTFTIPGHVNGRRRKYKNVFESFFQLRDCNFRLVLLGGIQDKKIVLKGKELLGNKLVFFNRLLSEEEYKNWLKSSHFLLSELNKDLYYGIFKASGVEFDGPALGIPVILPNDILQKAEHGFYIRYSRDNLTPLLKKLISSVENGDYKNQYLEPAMEKAKYFDENKWAKKLGNIIDELI